MRLIHGRQDLQWKGHVQIRTGHDHAHFELPRQKSPNRSLNEKSLGSIQDSRTKYN